MEDLNFDWDDILTEELEGQEDEYYYGQDNECYYGFKECLNKALRDQCGCIGCIVIIPPKKDE